MRQKITKRAVDAMQPGATISDTEVIGFRARRLKSGTVTYGYVYTDAGGRQPWLSLGLHGSITPEQARTLAKKAAGAVAEGRDPQAEREKERLAKVEASETLQVICESYLVIVCGMKRDAAGKATFHGELRTAYQRLDAFERLVWPSLGDRPIAAIKRSEIVKMLDTIAAENGLRQADLTLDYLSVVFNWHAVRSDNFRSPLVRGMKRVKTRERTRKRTLDDQEIRDVYAALDAAVKDLPICYPRYIRTLLLATLRRREASHAIFGEISMLHRDNVDGFNGKVWTIPEARMKNKLPHVVPLIPALIAMIGPQPRGAKYIFSTTGGQLPFSGYAKAKASLDKAINDLRRKDGRPPMPQWQHHDLRRTAKTLMQRAGVRPDISERVLSHVIPGVEGVYDQYEYLVEKADALTRLAALVDRIVHPPVKALEIPRTIAAE